MKNFINFIILITFLISSLNLKSENTLEFTEEMMNMNNAGTEFLMTFHPCWEEVGGNNAILIYVSSLVETEVTLEIPARGFKQTKNTTPNEVIKFHIHPDVALPYSKTDRYAPHPINVFKGQAIKITANDPIVCYGVVRYRYTSDTYMALPIQALGKEYVVASFPDPVNSPPPGRFQWLTSYASVVGVEDNTTVDFKLGGSTGTWVPINNHNVEDGLKQGETITRTINKGDVLLIPAMGGHGDLTGSYINANKPVAVFSGNFCAYIPLNVAACDYIIAQQLPIESWGNTYHVTPFMERKKHSYVSIFAKEDNTMVYRNGVVFANILKGNGGPSDEKGFIQIRISDSDAIQAHTLSSEQGKPISVTQYNTGAKDDGAATDPFQMSLIPIEQYKNHVLFNTPGANNDDFSFMYNFTNIIYLANEDNSIPDDLEIGRIENGQLIWEKIKDIETSTSYKLHTSGRNDNRSYFVKQLLLIWGDGVYQIRANDEIAVYSYGGSSFDSYGHPAASFVNDAQSGDILPPQIEILSLSKFNNEIDLVIEDKSNTINISGLGTVIFPSKDNFNFITDFDKFELGDHSTNVKLKVIDNTKPAQAAIYISDRAGNYTTEIFKYQPSNVPTIIDNDFDFGLLRVNNVVTKEFTLKNQKNEPTIKIDGLKISNETTNSFYLSSNLNFPLIMDANTELTFTINFKSDEDGEYSTPFSLIADGEDLPFGMLKAEVSQPYIEVSDIDFGSIEEGSDINEQVISIKNKGKFDLLITEITNTNREAFELLLEEINTENPLKVAAESEIDINVKLNTNVTGKQIAQINFTSDGKVIKDVSFLNAEVWVTSVTENTQLGINLQNENGILRFKSEESYLISNFKIIGIDGKTVYESNKQINLNELTYNTIGLSNGVYFISMSINNTVSSFKFIVNK